MVVTADDFGLAHHIDMGIIEAVRGGAISSISVCACGRNVDQALSLISGIKGLDMGIHLVISHEVPVSRPSKIPSLINSSHRFYPKEILILKYLSGGLNLDEVRREWEAQMEFLLKKGIRPTHMNSHQHLHLLPSLLKIAIKLQEEYKIPSMRLDPVEPLSLALRSPRPLPFLLIKPLSMITRAFYNEGRFHAFIGICHAGGRLDIKTLRRMLTANRGYSFLEVCLHPGLTPLEKSPYGHWRYNWHKDLQMVLSPMFRELIGQIFRPSSFKDLKGPHDTDN